MISKQVDHICLRLSLYKRQKEVNSTMRTIVSSLLAVIIILSLTIDTVVLADDVKEFELKQTEEAYNALVDGAKSLLASDNSSEDGFELNNSILWGFNGMTRAWLVTSLLSDLKNEAPDLYDSYLKDVSSSYIFLFPPTDKSITDYFSYWVVIFAGTECLHFTYTPEAPSCYYDTLKNVSIEDLISIFEDQATQIWEVTADDLNELNAMASGETMK